MDPPVSSMSSYVDQSSPGGGQMTQTHPQSMPEVTSLGNIEIAQDAGYYSTSPSQLVYPTPSPGLHTTPNTPTSIPDIILTGRWFKTDFNKLEKNQIPQEKFCLFYKQEFLIDFSAADDVRQFENDFFHESLKEGLGSLDFDEMQILTNPSINLPDSVEDNFKLNRS